MLGLANLGVALGELQSDRLREVGVEANALLQVDGKREKNYTYNRWKSKTGTLSEGKTSRFRRTQQLFLLHLIVYLSFHLMVVTLAKEGATEAMESCSIFHRLLPPSFDPLRMKKSFSSNSLPPPPPSRLPVALSSPLLRRRRHL